MSLPVTVTVQYTEKDFVRGMSFSENMKGSNIVWTVLPIFITLVIYALLYFLVLERDSQWTLITNVKFLFVGAIVTGVLYLMRNFSLTSQLKYSSIYESSPLLREEYSIEFGEEGISSRSESFSNKVLWQAVQKTAETEDDYHFFVGPGQSLFVPKRVFSKEQSDSLRALVKASLPDRYGFLR